MSICRFSTRDWYEYLVATTNRSRSLAISSPTIFSLLPLVYRLAVSIKLPPAETKASNIWRLVSLGAPQPQSSPKVIVPKHNSETRSPLLPNNLYRTIDPPSSLQVLRVSPNSPDRTHSRSASGEGGFVRYRTLRAVLTGINKAPTDPYIYEFSNLISGRSENPLPGAKSAGTGVSPSGAPFQDRGARRVGWVDLRHTSTTLQRSHINHKPILNITFHHPLVGFVNAID